MRFRITHLFLLGCMSAAISAQDLTPKAGPQKMPTALVNATIHTVSGAVIELGFVLFDQGRITQIGEGERMFAATIRQIDCKGQHVYPGLFSAQTQLGLREIGAVRASRDFAEVGQVTPEVRAAVAINPDSTLIPVARSNGILTAAVLPRGGLLPGRASVVRLEGWTWEEMAIDDDAGLVVNWPSVRPTANRRFDPSMEKQRNEIRDRLQRIRDTFEQARAYLATRAADDSTPVDLRWEGMRSVLEGKKPILVHAFDYDQIVSAVTFAAELKLRIVILGGRDAPLCADLMRKHKVPVILPGVFRWPKRRDQGYDHGYQLPQRLEAAGIDWCMTSGDRGAHERNLPYAAAMAVAHGLDKRIALESITLRPARILGLGKELGSIEEGKRATMIVTDGDPLEVTTHVLRAFIDGREVDLSNKQTELDKKYREKYRQLGLMK